MSLTPELLSNSMKVVEKYYSNGDTPASEVEKRLEDFWQNDPLTNTLTHGVEIQ